MRILRWVGMMVMVAFLGLTGCKGALDLVIEEPVAQLAVMTGAQIVGFEIAQNEPEIAKEMLDHVVLADRTDLLAYWPSWENYVTYKLVKNEHLRIVIQNLLESVNVRLEVQVPEEQEKIVRNVLEKFEQGLKDGLKGG